MQKVSDPVSHRVYIIFRVSAKLYLLPTNMMKQRLFSIKVYDIYDNHTRDRYRIKKHEINF